MNAATAHAVQDALRKAFNDRDRATVALGIDITYQPTRTTSNIADNSHAAGVGRF